MAVLAWVMMGLAVWHFTVFVPDRFVGGIVGAFLAAIAGAVIFGFLVSGLGVPARDDVDVVTALEGIPGAILGMAVAWAVGVARESRAPSSA
jgi:phosphoribosylformimino-5-aminoimidazole carboxamide ribonucleotide (ProFAR) isomerase